jgi:hypothetical protein
VICYVTAYEATSTVHVPQRCVQLQIWHSEHKFQFKDELQLPLVYVLDVLKKCTCSLLLLHTFLFIITRLSYDLGTVNNKPTANTRRCYWWPRNLYFFPNTGFHSVVTVSWPVYCHQPRALLKYRRSLVFSHAGNTRNVASTRRVTNRNAIRGQNRKQTAQKYL